MKEIGLNPTPYIKELRKIKAIKSASTAILMAKFEMLFSASSNEPFYKFLQPCDNDNYKKGLSWCEELGFSADEFRTAFSNIAIKYNSLSEYKKVVSEGGDPFQGYFYLAYTDKIKGLTFYLRNNDLLNFTINLISE